MSISEWKKNSFTLPKGKSEKDFISENKKLIEKCNVKPYSTADTFKVKATKRCLIVG